MSNPRFNLSRRELLKAGAGGVGALALLSPSPSGFAKGKYGPFDVGAQSYSLRGFPRDDMLQKMKVLGLTDLEGWDGHFAVTDDPNKIREYKDALKKAGIRMRSFGVESFGGDKEANRRIFLFARAMGVPVLTADPNPASFDNLEELTKEYNVKIAIHNHGPGARYDKPESVYAALEGRSERIGACLDAGHLLRSDGDPVEFVRHVGPRLFDVHVKDVAGRGNEARFVDIGQGRLDTAAFLQALKDIRFKGLVALEYEEKPNDPIPNMMNCLAAIRAAVRKLR
jgi:sugar phosphate isomerase/epimerase